MREFVCTGTMELRGVTFFIEAATEEEAIEKAKAGEWSDYDTNGAESVNWDMRESTLEANE